MIRVYVMGAYSANNVIDVLRNIGKGETYCAELFLEGFAPFCPWHDKDYVIKNWDKKLTKQLFYDFSMSWLEVSDCGFLIPDWVNSEGTLNEIKKCIELDIPIFNNKKNLLKYKKLKENHYSENDARKEAKSLTKNYFRKFLDVTNK